MDLSITKAFSSANKSPKVLMRASKTDKTVNDCWCSPQCDNSSPFKCTHCELQWSASLVSVIWSDALVASGLTGSEFLINHFNPKTKNGPPPDYFSKPGELTLTELEEAKVLLKRPCESETAMLRFRRRRVRIDSEEISSSVDSVGRESPAIKGEVAETYRVSSDMDDDVESIPEATELPISGDYDSNYTSD